MDPLTKLAEIFSHFPGIGPRQAKRFVYYILNRQNSDVKEFTKLIEEVKKLSLECSKCHRLYLLSSKLLAPSSSYCPICSDPSRDLSLLMIVARDSDFETIEKSGAYRGLYFVLGGSVPVLDKEPGKRIRLEKLLNYVTKSTDLETNRVDGSRGPFKEIILSLNTTPDGEHTAEIVRDALSRVTDASVTKISILGRGLSTGAELEYADGETIRNALRNRG